MRVTDDFLRAVENDADWNLTRRLDGKVHKTLKAKDLWEKIGYSAWASADPGLQYHTTINDWHTCPAAGPIIASNPCSEYMFLDDTACNLASLNLLQFRNNDTKVFDVESYEHAVRLWTVVLEISVMMAQFPSKEIAQLSYEYRTLGLGYANIGGLLMSSGLGYDLDEGRAICGALSAIMTGVCYATSAEMAGELGPFARYPENASHMLRVMRNHRRAAYGEASGYENLSINPVPLDHAACKDKVLIERALASLGISPSRPARRTATATPRPPSSPPPARLASSWIGDTTRSRAGLRSGEVQETRGRRLFQNHQPRRAGRPARARLHRSPAR